MTSIKLPHGMEINAPISADYAKILTHEALELVAKLSRKFEPRRQELLAARAIRAKELDDGALPDFYLKPNQSAKATGQLHQFHKH